MKKKKKGHCAICGNFGRVTKEHVPPKSLFPRPQMNPIIVPTCAECNGGSSSVDQRFATLMKLNCPTLNDDPDARKSVMQTLRKNKKLHRQILDCLEPYPIYTETGVYTGENGAVIKGVSTAGFDKLIEKIVRCLYFHHAEDILPNDAKIELFHDNLLWEDTSENIEYRQEHLKINTLLDVGQINDPESFFYRWGICDDVPHNSLWNLHFKSIHYTAFVRLP